MNISTTIPFKEILHSIPGFFGIRLEEEPKFDVIETLGDVEIRRYAPALLAQVTVIGEHDQAVNDAFRILASYIFGGNSSGEKMDMTSPVLQQAEQLALTASAPVIQNPSGHGWTVSFFVSNELTPQTAPRPDDPSVMLVQTPENVMAALRYTGNNTDESRIESRQALLAALAGHSKWRVADDVAWAQYDQPFSIPFLKRNEALVALSTNA
ncbi:MAG: heme-binding protein [Dokdonella sp.]